MNDELDKKKFMSQLEMLYSKGGSPEYVVAPGLGQFYWPKLTEVERAYVIGWFSAVKYVKDGGKT